MILRRLTIIVTDVLAVPGDEIDPHIDMSDYGFDSLTLVTFADRINADFSLDISPAQFFEFRNLGGLADAIMTMTAAMPASHTLQESEKQQPPALSDITVKKEIHVTRPTEPLRITTPSPRKQEAIALIGISGRFPGSPDLHAYWHHLEAGHDLITEVPADRWDWRAWFGDPHEESGKTRARWGGFP